MVVCAFEIRLGKYMCLTRGCDFVIHRKYELKDERLQTNKMNEPALTTAPLREIYHCLFIQQCLFLVAVRYFCREKLRNYMLSFLKASRS